MLPVSVWRRRYGRSSRWISTLSRKSCPCCRWMAGSLPLPFPSRCSGRCSSPITIMGRISCRSSAHQQSPAYSPRSRTSRHRDAGTGLLCDRRRHHLIIGKTPTGIYEINSGAPRSSPSCSSSPAGVPESPPAQPTVSPTSVPGNALAGYNHNLPTPVITPARTASVSDNTITIVKNTFNPANMTVKVSSTVRWVNTDDHPHNIEFTDKAFSTSTYLLGASQSFSQRFDQCRHL